MITNVEVIHRQHLDITIDLSYEESDLIRRLGNKIGGHDEILEDFILDNVKKNLKIYLIQKLGEN